MALPHLACDFLLTIWLGRYEAKQKHSPRRHGNTEPGSHQRRFAQIKEWQSPSAICANGLYREKAVESDSRISRRAPPVNIMAWIWICLRGRRMILRKYREAGANSRQRFSVPALRSALAKHGLPCLRGWSFSEIQALSRHVYQWKNTRKLVKDLFH